MVQFNMDVPPAEYVRTEEEGYALLRQLLELVENEPDAFIGFDTETYGKKIPLRPKADGTPSKSDPLDWMQDTVTFWSLAAKLDGEARRWTLPVQLLAIFVALLENPKANIVTWNGKYDAHVSYNSGVYVWSSNYMDGLAMAHLVDENLQGSLGLKQTAAAEYPFFHPERKHSPDTYWSELVEEGLIEEWVPIPMTKFGDLFPKTDKMGRKIVEFEYSIFDLFKEWPDRVIDYASLDAHATRLLCEHLRDVMKVLPIEAEGGDSNMWEYFVEMEIPCTEILWRMERRGLCINSKFLNNLIGPMNKELLRIEKAVFKEAGWPVSLTSPAELCQLFFGAKDGQVKRGKEFIDAPGLGLAPIKKTKGGKTSLPKPSTDKDVLDELAIMGVKVAKLIKRHRSVAKTKSTYVDTVTKLCKHHKDGRLHPEFKQFGARTGRFSTKTPNCYGGLTEVLTKKGWVRFDELKEGKEIAQWHEEGTVSFTVPIAYHKAPYEGEMVSLSNQHIDLLLTPDHRCPLLTRTRRLKIVPASGYEEDRKQLHGGLYNFPGTLPLSTDSLRFLLAVQADGHWHDGGIDFAFTKERKAKLLKEILDGLAAPYGYNPNQKGRHRFRVKAGPLVEMAKEFLGNDRKLGPWVLDMSNAQALVFAEDIFFWDGCWKRKSMYASKHKSDADWVQIVLTLMGCRVKVRAYEPSNPNAGTSYQTDVTYRDFSMTTNIEKKYVPWDEKVYCVTVPTGFILVRRNGKVVVCGQSQNFPRPDTDEFGIRKAFIAPSGAYVLIVADYCLAKGTRVDGPMGSRKIEDLEPGDLVYGYNKKTSRPCVVEVKRKTNTGRRKTVVVELDNGRKVRTTPDHRWLTIEEKEIRADELVPGTRLLPLRKGSASDQYRPTLYSHSNRRYVYEHKEVAKAVFGTIPKTHHVHHKDNNVKNNHPDNLELMEVGQHLSLHGKETATKQWKDPSIRKKMVEGISQAIKDRGGYNGSRNPNYGNKKGPEAPCAYCEKIFYAPPCRSQKFCSRECYFKSKNHKVTRVVHDGKTVPTYDIEVGEDHIFALEAGVFVHNCQLEMRIMAHFSQDEGMLEAIRAGMDLHCFAVEKMYGIPYDEVAGAKKRLDDDDVEWDDLTEHEQDCLRKRQICKNTGFAIIFGAGAPRISSMLEIPMEDAEDILALYFESFPGVTQFMEDVVDQCSLYEYVTTLVGRRRRLPDVNHHQYVKRGHAEREAINAPIQGSAADITKAAMINIERDPECQRLGVVVVNQVHDELVMECPRKNRKAAKARVKTLMEKPFAGRPALCVPTPADVKDVGRWDQAK